MKNCIQPKSHQKGHGKLAVITGADGGMGMEITRYVALAGFRVIMMCHHRNEAEKARQILIKETGNTAIEVLEADFSSLKSVAQATEQLLIRQECIALLMNNAGTTADAIIKPNNTIKKMVNNVLFPTDQIRRDSMWIPKDLASDTTTVAIMPAPKPTLYREYP